MAWIKSGDLRDNIILARHMLDGILTAAKIAASAINGTHMKAGALKIVTCAGAAAGNVTLTGIATDDKLISVQRLDRDATAANINLSTLTAEFTITAADTINNTGGTNTTGDTLLVAYWDVSV